MTAESSASLAAWVAAIAATVGLVYVARQAKLATDQTRLSVTQAATAFGQLEAALRQTEIANEALRLEAEPYLLIEPHDAQAFIDSWLEIKLIQQHPTVLEIQETKFVTEFQIGVFRFATDIMDEDGHLYTVFRVRNIGRSPAVDCEIEFGALRYAGSGISIEPDKLIDMPAQVKCKTTLNCITPSGEAFIGIINRAAAVRISVEGASFRRKPHGRSDVQLSGRTMVLSHYRKERMPSSIRDQSAE